MTGDGVGKEITDSVKEIFEACNAPIEFEEFSVSGETSQNEAEFKKSVDSLRRNKVGLKGAARPAKLPSQGKCLHRHPLYTSRTIWSCFMERGHASTARHLRSSRLVQIGRRLPYKAQERGFRHHSRKHRRRILWIGASVVPGRSRELEDHDCGQIGTDCSVCL
jgi:hypothetical protein